MARVSDDMIVINGQPSERLRSMLEHWDCVLRRVYSAATGRAENYWVVISQSEITVVQVHRRTVERWVREQWADTYVDSPTDHRPDTGVEWCVLRRCGDCGCVGYGIDGAGRCAECARNSSDPDEE